MQVRDEGLKIIRPGHTDEQTHDAQYVRVRVMMSVVMRVMSVRVWVRMSSTSRGRAMTGRSGCAYLSPLHRCTRSGGERLRERERDRCGYGRTSHL